MNGTTPYSPPAARYPPRQTAQKSSTGASQPAYGQRPPRPTPFVSLAASTSKDSLHTDASSSMRSSSFLGVDKMPSNASGPSYTTDGRARPAAGLSPKPRTKKTGTAGTKTRTAMPMRSPLSSLETSPTPASLTRSQSFTGRLSNHAKTPRGTGAGSKRRAAPHGTHKISSATASPSSPAPLQKQSAKSIKSPRSLTSSVKSAHHTTGGLLPLRRAETSLHTAMAASLRSPKTSPKRFMTIYTKSPSPDYDKRRPQAGQRTEKPRTGLPSRQTSATLSSGLQGANSPSSSPSADRPSHGPREPQLLKGSTRTGATSASATEQPTSTSFVRSATTMGGVTSLSRAPPSTQGGTFLAQWRAKQQQQQEPPQPLERELTGDEEFVRRDVKTSSLRTVGSAAASSRTLAKSPVTPLSTAPTAAARSRRWTADPEDEAKPSRPAPTTTRTTAATRRTNGADDRSRAIVQRVPTPEQALTESPDNDNDNDGDEDDLADSAVTSPSSVSLVNGPESSPASTKKAVTAAAVEKKKETHKSYHRESPINHDLNDELLPDTALTTDAAQGRQCVTSPPAIPPLAPPLSTWSHVVPTVSTESMSARSSTTGTRRDAASSRQNTSASGSTGTATVAATVAAKSTSTATASFRPGQRQTSQLSVESSTRPSPSHATTPYLEDLEDFIQQQQGKLRQRTESTRSDTAGDRKSTTHRTAVSNSPTPPPSASAAAALLAESGIDLDALRLRTAVPLPSTENGVASTRTTHFASRRTTPVPAASATSSATTRAAATVAPSTPLGHTAAVFARQDSSSKPLRDVLTRREQRLQRQASSTLEIESSETSAAPTQTHSLAASPRPLLATEKPPVPVKVPAKTASTTTTTVTKELTAPLPAMTTTTTPAPAPFERQPSALELYRRRQSLGVKPVLSPSHRAATTTLPDAPPSLPGPGVSPTKPQLSQPQSRRTSMASMASQSSSTFVSTLSSAPPRTAASASASGTSVPSPAPAVVLFERHTATPSQTTTTTTATSSTSTKTTGTATAPRKPARASMDDATKSALLRAAEAALQKAKPTAPVGPAAPPLYTEVPGFDEEDEEVPEDEDGLGFSDGESSAMHSAHSTDSGSAEHDKACTMSTSLSSTPVPSVVPKLNFARLPSASTSLTSQPVVLAAGAGVKALPGARADKMAKSSTSVASSTPPSTITTTTTAQGGTVNASSTPPAASASAIDELEESVNAMLKHYTTKPTPITITTATVTTTTTTTTTSPEWKFDAIRLSELSMPSVLLTTGGAEKAVPMSAAPPLTAAPVVTIVPNVTVASIIEYRSKELQEKVDALLGKSSASAVSSCTTTAVAPRLVKVDAVSLAALKAKPAKAKDSGLTRLADVNRRLANKSGTQAHSHSDDDEDAPVDPLAEWCAPDEQDPHNTLHFEPTYVPESVPPLDFSKLFLDNDKDAFDKYRVALPTAVADPMTNYAALLEHIGTLLPTPIGTPLVPRSDTCDTSFSRDLAEAAVERCHSQGRRASRSSVSVSATGSPFLGRSTNGVGLEDVQFVPVVSHESSTDRFLRSVQELNSHDCVNADDKEAAPEANGSAEVSGTAKVNGGARPRVNRTLQLTDESDALDGGRGREREDKVREHKRSVDRLLFSYQEQRARKVVVAEETSMFGDLTDAFTLAKTTLSKAA